MELSMSDLYFLDFLAPKCPVRFATSKYRKPASQNLAVNMFSSYISNSWIC